MIHRIVLLCVISLIGIRSLDTNEEINIGIIGCGISSSSFAYFLNDYLKKVNYTKKINIDIYEQEAKVM